MEAIWLPFAFLIASWPIWLVFYIILRAKSERKKLARELDQRRTDAKISAVTSYHSLLSSLGGPLIENCRVVLYESAFDARDAILRSIPSSSARDRPQDYLAQVEKGRVSFLGKFIAMKCPVPAQEREKVLEVFQSINRYNLTDRLVPPIAIFKESPAAHGRGQAILERQHQKYMDAVRRNALELIDESDEPTRPYPGSVAVYIMHADGRIKIGLSDDPQNRRRELQTGNPDNIYLVSTYWMPNQQDAFVVEQTAHGLLSLEAPRLRGEWFKASRDRAKMAVELAIFELSSTRKISVAPTGIRNVEAFNTQVRMAKKLRSGWTKSKKGNWFIRDAGRQATVFKGKSSRWKFVVDGVFSKQSFEKLSDARSAALAALGREHDE